MKQPATSPVNSTSPKSFELVQPPATPSPSFGFTMALGELRPRFESEGALREFYALAVNYDRATANDRWAFEEQLVNTLLPARNAPLPDAFYVARNLVWPLFDGLGVPRAIVEPTTNREIVALLDAMLEGFKQPRGRAFVTVHGQVRGLASSLGGLLYNLPRVVLLAVKPFCLDDLPRTGCSNPSQREFEQLMPLLANNGTGDRLRAANLVLLQSKALYKTMEDLQGRRGCDPAPGYRLVAISARDAASSVDYPLIDVIYTFAHCETGAPRQYFERVDVRGPFPFLTMDDALPYYGSVAPAIDGPS